MRKFGKNIEDFIREKLRQLENTPSQDWSLMEAKLRRALFLKRLRLAGTFCAVVLAMWWANQFWVSPFLQELFYEPGVSQEFQDQPLQADFEDQSYSVHLEEGRNFAAPVFRRSFAVSAPKAKAPVVKEVSQTPPEPVQRPEALSVNLAAAPVLKNVAPIASQRLGMQALPSYVPRRPKKKEDRHEGENVMSDIYVSPLQSKNPWSYAFNIYPNFAFREFRINEDKMATLHRDFIDEISTSEKNGFSLNVGLEVSRQIGPVTYLNSGIEYITNTYRAQFNFMHFRDANIDPATGEILNYRMRDNPQEVKFTDQNEYHYANFPLSISYQPWLSKHLRMNMEVGGSYMHFLRAEGTTLDFRTLEEVDLSSREYREGMGSFSMKIGLQYWVDERINIGFEPTLMYFTETIFPTDYPLHVVPYSVGLNFNIQVKLNR